VGEKSLELVIGNWACLQQSIHAPLDLNRDMAIVNKCMEVVVVMMAGAMTATGMCM